MGGDDNPLHQALASPRNGVVMNREKEENASPFLIAAGSQRGESQKEASHGVPQIPKVVRQQAIIEGA
jgi:hypothetical protein